MRDINSLRLNTRFKRVYTKGRSSASPYLVLYARPVSKDAGFGITASKKIGKAVQRNRAKRRIRALYRKYKKYLHNDFDIVAVARTRTVTAPFEKLEASFLQLAKETGILKDMDILEESR